MDWVKSAKHTSAGGLAHLEHLGRTDDWLSRDIALGNHHLLRHEYLTGRDLDSEISTSHHDTVRLLENLVKILHTLLVFNLDDDFDSRSLGSKHLSNMLDILSRADKRRKDHVNIVLDAECKVGLVLLRQRGEVDGCLGEVDTFSGRESTRVEGFDSELVAFNVEDLKGEDTWASAEKHL